MIVPYYAPPPNPKSAQVLFEAESESETNSQLVRRFIWPESSVRWPLATRGQKALGSVVSSSPVDAGGCAAALEAEIARAKVDILGLEPDWDGEGGQVYHAETLERAALFARAHCLALFQSCGSYGPSADFGPGPEGSIDIFWASEYGKLLVNIPAALSEQATFAGTDSTGQRLKGSFDPQRVNRGILAWMISLLGQ